MDDQYGPGGEQPILGLESDLENNHAVGPRLDILSLKRALDLSKAEFNGINCWREEDKFKSKAKMLWKISCSVIKRHEHYGNEAIELMETLVYFGSVRIDSNIFHSEDVLDTKSAMVKTLLPRLQYYGLIDIYDNITDSWDPQVSIELHSILLAFVIREKTEPIEVDMLKKCFSLLRKQIWSPDKRTVYLREVWDEASKNTELVKRYKTDGIQLCKKLYTPSPMIMDVNAKNFVGRTTRMFKTLLRSTDPVIIWIQCVELEMLLTVMENAEMYSCEVEIVLNECQSCRSTIDQYTKSRGGREDILEIFERLADKIFMMAARTKEFESRILEESYEFYKLLHNRRRNNLDYGKFYMGILRCLKGLQRTSEILDLLCEIRKIIQNKKSKMDKLLDEDYYYYLHCIPKAVLDLNIVDFSNITETLDGLEKSIMEELLIILKIGYFYLSQRLRQNVGMFLDGYFSETMLILVMCLIKLEKAEELLTIVVPAHKVWRSILMDKQYDLPYYCKDSTKVIAHKYLKILSLVFEMAVVKKNLKIKTIKTLSGLCKNLCSHTLRYDVYRDFPSDEATSFLIIQCCLELNRPDLLINHSKEYEKLLRDKFETKLVPIAQAMIALGEKQVKHLKPVPNRVEYFPLLKSIMSNAKIYGKIISEDLLNINLDTIKTAKETTEFCQHRLSSEWVAVDDSWSWGTEWYKIEKQEVESAKKLFL